MTDNTIDPTRHYQPIVQHLVSPADKNPIRERLGKAHECRYCGKTGPVHFTKTAHALPQSLGNNRLISLDECDACNAHFAGYENELVNFYGPVRTMLGLPNKDRAPSTADAHRKVRRHGRQISVRTSGVDSLGSELSFGYTTSGRRKMNLRLPAPHYSPYRAFLALQKCAIALLDPSVLAAHSNILAILRGESLPPAQLIQASLSLTDRGPTLFAAVLHERSDDRAIDIDLRLPKRVFCLYVAYTCLVIPVLDDTMIQFQTERPHLRLNASLAFPNGELVYRHSHRFDWSSSAPTRSPFAEASIVLPD